MVDCLKCLNSACCSLQVELDIKEYEHFKKLGFKEFMTTRTEMFIKKNIKYKGKEKYFDSMYKDNFAILNKNLNGQCVFLDKKKECSIYEKRPKICKEYKTKSCVNIRELIN